jgi:two-component system, cell cycle response regulator DivK
MTRKKILIADDKPSSRELVRIVVEHLGFDVIEAGDGEEAVAKARTEGPSLILADLQMPKLDGFGVLSAVRSDAATARIPVIAVTAYAMSTDREKALRAGFDSYVSKPIGLGALRSEIARLLAPPPRTAEQDSAGTAR